MMGSESAALFRFDRLTNHSTGFDGPNRFQSIVAKHVEEVVQHVCEVDVTGNQFKSISDFEILRGVQKIKSPVLGGQLLDCDILATRDQRFV